MASKIAEIVSEEVKKYNLEKGENLEAKAWITVYGYRMTYDITEMTQKLIKDLQSRSIYLHEAFIVKRKENLSPLRNLFGRVYPKALKDKLMTVSARMPSVKIYDAKYGHLAKRIENRINA